MARNSQATTFLCIILVITTSLTLLKLAESIPLKDTVDILNLIQTGPITTHCRSHDNDLGVRVLAPNEKMNWRFHRNFWGTTLFYCLFISPTGQHQTLEVWSTRVMAHSKCFEKCFWYVKPDGFYVTDYDYSYGGPESAKFMAPWA